MAMSTYTYLSISFHSDDIYELNRFDVFRCYMTSKLNVLIIINQITLPCNENGKYCKITVQNGDQVPNLKLFYTKHNSLIIAGLRYIGKDIDCVRTLLG